jgi:predicted amidophosphoribosyltransferase
MFELLSALGADTCVACNDSPCLPGALEGRTCADCASELPRALSELRGVPEGCRRAWQLAPYAGAGGTLVRVAKYGGDGATARALARRLALGVSALHLLDPGFCADLVVPVPTSRWRTAWRGLSLPAVSARTIAELTELPTAQALGRRWGRPQAALPHARRRANARGRFLSRDVDVQGRKLLLVDDVLTTGATLSACARALLEAGAARVDVVVLAGPEG